MTRPTLTTDDRGLLDAAHEIIRTTHPDRLDDVIGRADPRVAEILRRLRERYPTTRGRAA
jgi:hypothetical protein